MSRLMQKLMVLVIVVGLVVAFVPRHEAPSVEAQMGVAYWPTDGWRTATPESQGMDSAELAQ